MAIDSSLVCFPDDTIVCVRVYAMDSLARVGASDPFVAQWVYQPGIPITPPGIADAEKSSWILRRVQALRYAVDASGDCVATPREVLLAGGGDCKRLSILLSASLHVLQVPNCIVWVMQPGAPLNHVSVLVWVSGEWVWSDPSVAGARLGEAPYAASRRLGVRRVELSRAGRAYRYSAP